MAKILQFRRATTAEISTITGAEGELFIDLDKNTVVTMDGATAGGYPLATESYVETSFSEKTTTDLTEGDNLYFTEERARNAISVTGDLTYDPTTGVLGVTSTGGYDSSQFDTDFGTKTTTDLTEGDNLYYTTSRVDDHLTGGTGVTYDAGEISIGQSVGTEDTVTFDTVNATDFNSTSDASFKENISEINNALDLVSAMRGVRYTWKDTGDPGIGVIAQEMETVLPEVVTDTGSHKTVGYGNIVGVLIEAIKELNDEITELKSYK